MDRLTYQLAQFPSLTATHPSNYFQRRSHPSRSTTDRRTLKSTMSLLLVPISEQTLRVTGTSNAIDTACSGWHSPFTWDWGKELDNIHPRVRCLNWPTMVSWHAYFFVSSSAIVIAHESLPWLRHAWAQSTTSELKPYSFSSLKRAIKL